ncbi:malto-oligosyltrehalose synthase [Streptomyces sp. RFCAC02]|uniref:malto-oligosyltrehalose synthase n=1 Tax=Streptomyces sp. RFCAC02 TaxID=2499143 RepID=UPI0010211D31|nr:malto-oligosyltrehalose synthase [Streptomyces sp. RFCAC02]
MTTRRTPSSTYRVQLGPAFPFAAAEEIVPYAASLGVTHLHLSPVLEAVPGSEHGYDVTDHRRVREELGGEAGLRSLAGAARRHGLGIVLDIVPNHMAVPAAADLNAPLWDVLAHGPGAAHAHWFDIDWEAGGGKVLLPVLGGPLGDELASLTVEDGTLRYWDHRFPLRPGTEHLPVAELVEAQHYRLAWWRLGRTELNYRRFFTISDLIAVRVEDPGVFDATHATVLRLVADGLVDGLRIDHPDGLADPGAYLRRLHERTGGAWIVAEKILGSGEQLPASWPIAGTTGYDALRHVDAVLTSGAGCERLTEHYRTFTGAPPDLGGVWAETVRRAAYRMITRELAAETDRLARAAGAACRALPELRLRDHAPWALRTALVELLVGLPVYRPYVTADGPASPVDTALLATAADGARAAFPVPGEAAAVDTVRDLVLGGFGRAGDEVRVRFAQLASALRAKSVEDTAGYRYAPLLSAAEVGGEPGTPSLPPAAFHAFCARMQRDWPLTGTVLSTHDTKRSGDVRAALAALSEVPDAWAALVTRLTEETASATGVRAPDPHLAWTVWQTAYALGGGAEGERLGDTVVKTMREAALHTTWTEPDEAYESAARRFLAAGPGGAAGGELAAFVRDVAPLVRANVLGAALLHLTMPGVPDVYRGSETLYTALVDPDNRRVPDLPVARLAALDGEAGTPADLADEKLRLTATALRLRRDHPEWFGPEGDYHPLEAEGEGADHCLAFTRADRVLTAVTRLPGTLAENGGWTTTHLQLPPGTWHDTLTSQNWSGTTPLTALFATTPVALLVRMP